MSKKRMSWEKNVTPTTLSRIDADILTMMPKDSASRYKISAPTASSRKTILREILGTDFVPTHITEKGEVVPYVIKKTRGAYKKSNEVVTGDDVPTLKNREYSLRINGKVCGFPTKPKSITIGTESPLFYNTVKNNKMEDCFEEVKILSELDAEATAMTHLCKFAEEFGEVATDVNKLIGRKKLKGDETMESVKENLTGEIASNFQLLFIIADKFGITYKELYDTFKQENLDYEKYIRKIK